MVKMWLWLVPVIGGMGLVLLLRKSESDQIRDDLHAMAEACRFAGPSTGPAWSAALSSRLIEHVAAPVTIRIEPMGEVRLSTDQLRDSISRLSAQFAGFGVTLSNIGVKVDPDGRRAAAKGEALIDLLERSGERRAEPRRFAATFELQARRWLLVHVQFTEPRIDQPEARP